MNALVRAGVMKLDESDNVGIAARRLPAEMSIPSLDVRTTEDIPLGHKICLEEIQQGAPVLKYRTVIGYARRRIARGEWVHEHNVEFGDVDRDYRFAKDYRPAPVAETRETFMGIRRSPSVVATRNYIGIFITVNCAATVARKIAAHFNETRLAAYPNVDGVIPFIHEQGCGMEMSGEPMDLLRRTLGGYIRHPNFAGALVCSLGCERNNLQEFFGAQGLKENKQVRIASMQGLGGTRRAIQSGIEAIEEMLETANRASREPCSVEHLMIGLQCGGSDGLSGITANPALGRAVDLLANRGGTAILSETPELYGVEHILTARARNREVGERLLGRIDWWLEHSKGTATQINGVISPGNRSGGLVNVLEKSLGGVKKSGSTGLEAVYNYAEQVTASGLVFMDTPGFDPVSVTGQIAGGANVICFTTGRGSCFGSYPSPTIKIASNSEMYTHMTDDMDINAGKILDGTTSLDDVGREIFEKIKAVASGTMSKSDELGIGEDEFAPWPIGITT